MVAYARVEAERDSTHDVNGYAILSDVPFLLGFLLNMPRHQLDTVLHTPCIDPPELTVRFLGRTESVDFQVM